ncbi:hypothetical protein [Roseiflexus castenholzii]|uniref:hypothetical protein n=1 Tax=Roseiflexus castenholzii TaxID=120962 RepID=UPI003C7D630A
MSAPTLIQQQREILRAFSRAEYQYREQVNQAKARLDNALARIQQAKDAAEQEAKQEYENHISAILDFLLSAESNPQEKREQLRSQLMSSLNTRKVTTLSIDNMELIKGQMSMIVKKFKEDRNKTMMAILAGGCLLFLLSFGVFPINLFVFYYLWQDFKKQQTKVADRQNPVPNLTALYHRWLELIAQQAQAQEAQARQAYQQAMAQAEQQRQAARQQLAAPAAEFTRQADSVTPPWQDPAWQSWQPGTLPAGLVRLGVCVDPAVFARPVVTGAEGISLP